MILEEKPRIGNIGSELFFHPRAQGSRETTFRLLLKKLERPKPAKINVLSS
jgi:hypothetical protein